MVMRLSDYRCSRRFPIETTIVNEAVQVYLSFRCPRITSPTQSACCHHSPHFRPAASPCSRSTEIALTSDVEEQTGTYQHATIPALIFVSELSQSPLLAVYGNCVNQ